MNINLDKVLGWDLQLTIGGKDYDTRPPTLAELALLQAIDKNDVAALQKQMQLLSSGLLCDAAAGLSDEQTQAVIITVMEYWKESVQKNAQTIASKIRVAMGKPAVKTETSGSSTAS